MGILQYVSGQLKMLTKLEQPNTCDPTNDLLNNEYNNRRKTFTQTESCRQEQSNSGCVDNLNIATKESSSNASPSPSQWAPAKLPLLQREQVHLIFHEIGIERGYRQPGGQWTDYVYSIFSLNNETLNVWTHLLAFLLADLKMIFIIYNMYVFGSFLLSRSFATDPYHWPFLMLVGVCGIWFSGYLLAACIWPLVSCLAHVFGSMSVRARHMCFLADYAALSTYSFGVGLAYHAYSFDRRLFAFPLSSYYPWIACASAVFCTSLSAYSRIMDKRMFWQRKIARSAAFLIPYVIVNVPLALRIYWHLVHDQGQLSDAVAGHLKQFMFITIAFTFYNLHLPERLWPGRFDLVGHSHQPFHVFGALATWAQMWAIHADLGHARTVYPARVDTIDLALFAVLLAVNVYIVTMVLSVLHPTTKGLVDGVKHGVSVTSVGEGGKVHAD